MSAQNAVKNKLTSGRPWLVAAVPVLVGLGLVSLGLAGRLIDHAPNFTPIVAIALFAGFFFRRAWVSACAMLGIMLVTDLVIGMYEPALMAAVYGALLVPVGLRWFLRRRLTPVRLGAATLGSSLAFFVVSNAAVWALTPWYEASASGLVACFAAAVPFFKNQLAGDLLFSAGLFSTYALATRAVRARYAATPLPSCAAC